MHPETVGLPQVVYRLATDVDATALAVIAQLHYGGEAAAWRLRMVSSLHRPGALVVVAESAEGVIGYGKAARCSPLGPDDPAPAGLYLTGVVVSPAGRRAGVGSGLTRRRLQWIWESGEPAWYITNAANTASLVMHARLGFREVGRAASYLGERFTGGIGVLCRADAPSAAGGA